MAYTPLRVKMYSREFWGILLDDSLKFKVDSWGDGSHGVERHIPFDYIQTIVMHDRRFNYPHTDVFLVDGSVYQYAEIDHGTQLTFASIGGNQSVEIGGKQEYQWFTGKPLGKYNLREYQHRVEFATPTVSDVEKLRSRLKQVLTANRRQLVEQVGADNLKTFFNLDLR